MRSNQSNTEECTDPANIERKQAINQFCEEIELLGLYFETKRADGWVTVTTSKTDYTTSELQQHYGPVRNVTELVSLDAVEEVLSDAR